MRLKKRDWLIVGFFTFLQILIVLRNLIAHTYLNFFWFCDIAPLILILAFLFKDEHLTRAVVNIGLMAQLFFSILLILELLFHIGIIIPPPVYGKFFILVEFLIHLLPVNFAFFLIREEKPKKKSLLYSFIILVTLFVLSRLFTSPDFNANFAFYLFGISFPLYILFPIWIILAFLFLVLPNYLLQSSFKNGKFHPKELKKRFDIIIYKSKSLLRHLF